MGRPWAVDSWTPPSTTWAPPRTCMDTHTAQQTGSWTEEAGDAPGGVRTCVHVCVQKTSFRTKSAGLRAGCCMRPQALHSIGHFWMYACHTLFKIRAKRCPMELGGCVLSFKPTLLSWAHCIVQVRPQPSGWRSDTCAHVPVAQHAIGGAGSCGDWERLRGVIEQRS